MMSERVYGQNVQVQSLGEAAVYLGGERVVWSKSTDELFWYLHAHEAGCYRHQLLADLWQLEENPASANRFRVTLHRLRSSLGRSAVLEDHGRYHLHPDFLAASDTAQLLGALQAQCTSPQEQEEALRRAAAAGQGEYLPHISADWVQPFRAFYRAAQLRAYLALSELHCQRCECALSASTLAAALERDPLLDEQYHQRLMVCLGDLEGKYAATEYYRRYSHYLRSEVGDTPLPETVALAKNIKDGQVTCPRRALLRVP
ncbi:BTAD domain-containing putative transcriptional regulator [Deinococcus lacus]|uniref:BTAD domain-containing putative transcriptional regulator n=1 Tax=Deinococcus lacus TaxID=392561 RepID=A0ABW1YF50_9DEIO